MVMPIASAPTDFGPLADPMPPIAAPKTGGMFGSGMNLGQLIALGVMGYAAGRGNPMGQMALQSYFQNKQRQYDEKQREAEYQQHRGDELTDYAKKQQIQQQYAPPPQPGEFERALMASGVQPGTPEWTQAMKTRASNMLDPIVNTPYGPIMRSMVAPQMPTKPVGTLTPIDDGGPTPSASGGFRY